ncbi:MAG: NTP transferase domain-containing protein [Pirellulales bacterium]|nr:NTP transferase domain-containing protein [Pirellulales bacterium]
MLKTLGIVQACCHVQHISCKAARRLGGRPVLEWVIRRVTESQRLDGVIVVTCDCPDHHTLAKLVPPDIPLFVGSQPDALGRFVKALEMYPAQAVVRVRGDNLFIDPTLIDRLVTSAEGWAACDYASYSSRDGRPAILSPVGIYAEWFKTGALRRADRHAKKLEDREHVTHYLYSHPEKFNLRLIPAPTEIDRDDVRLSVEKEEDWDHVLTLYEALGPERLDWRGIADLLDHQPALRNRMAELNRDFATTGW